MSCVVAGGAWQWSSVDSQADACAGNLVLEGGRDRVVFRLLMEVERLEATFNYESAAAPPLLLAAIEDVRFNVTVNPGTLVINASLGNMRAQDCVLPEVGSQG